VEKEQLSFVFFVLASTSPEVLAARKAEIWSSLDEQTKALYGEAYLKRLYTNFEACVPRYPTNVAPVVSAMCSALFSKQPKSRYAVGRGASFLISLLTMLPSWITDRLSMAVMSITSCDVCPAKLQQPNNSSVAAGC